MVGRLGVGSPQKRHSRRRHSRIRTRFLLSARHRLFPRQPALPDLPHVNATVDQGPLTSHGASFADDCPRLCFRNPSLRPCCPRPRRHPALRRAGHGGHGGHSHSHRVPSTHEACQTLRTERLHHIPDLARLTDHKYSGAGVHAQLVVHAAFALSDLSITIPSVNLLHHSESAIYTPQSRTHA
jgi:hypothetical protein